MRPFVDKLSQSLTSQILSVIAAAIFGYYSGIYGLKDELYELRKENSELRDLVRVEIAKVNKLIAGQRVLIAGNEQYISMVAKPSDGKLQELEKKIYLIEKDVAITILKAENLSAGKKKALSAQK